MLELAVPANSAQQRELKARLSGVHHSMVETVQSAATIDMRKFEGKAVGEVRSALGPTVISLLGRSLADTSELFLLCDQWDTQAQPAQDTDMGRGFGYELDRMLENDKATTALDSVADLAFVARSELRDRQARLSNLEETDDAWQLLAEYDSALRVCRKSLAAVECALCSAESLPRCLEYETELEISLRVRSAYVLFRKKMLGTSPPDEETVFRRLRLAGGQIAMLVGKDIYAQLRFRDRAQLRGMQNRILDWLRSSSEDTKAGLRIWQDLAAMVDMFCQVSLRQEVVAHDKGVIERLSHELQALDASQVHSTIVAMAQNVAGLDARLDELLATDTRDAELWRSTVSRLASHFGIHVPTPMSFFRQDDEFL
jgi:hypothetical protein